MAATKCCIILNSTPATREICVYMCQQHEILNYNQPEVLCICDCSMVDAKKHVLMHRNFAYMWTIKEQETIDHCICPMNCNHLIFLSFIRVYCQHSSDSQQTINFCSFFFVSSVWLAIKVTNECFYNLSNVSNDRISIKIWSRQLWKCECRVVVVAQPKNRHNREHPSYWDEKTTSLVGTCNIMPSHSFYLLLTFFSILIQRIRTKNTCCLLRIISPTLGSA